MYWWDDQFKVWMSNRTLVKDLPVAQESDQLTDDTSEDFSLGKRKRAEDEDDALRPIKRLTLATVWEEVCTVISKAVNAIWQC